MSHRWVIYGLWWNWHCLWFACTSCTHCIRCFCIAWQLLHCAPPLLLLLLLWHWAGLCITCPLWRHWLCWNRWICFFCLSIYIELSTCHKGYFQISIGQPINQSEACLIRHGCILSLIFPSAWRIFFWLNFRNNSSPSPILSFWVFNILNSSCSSRCDSAFFSLFPPPAGL